MSRAHFSTRLLRWYNRHGRVDLPWQREVSPYRVWVSEIMLQQTQVATVIPYFERFMARFPTIAALADASLDEVLRLWSGLGYYARARNLHKGAQIIRTDYDGAFPEYFEDIVALPGIGRSTAGAIQSLARSRRHAILDGNIKRVLCRHRAVTGWPGRTRTAQTLWGYAEALTPTRRVAAYNQAMMDLGTLVCRRGQPLCTTCPVAADCLARQRGQQHLLPTPKPRTTPPERETCMIMIRNPRNQILLERRPPTGVWGGLLSFPETASTNECIEWYRRRFQREPARLSHWRPIRHTFTHFRLVIHPIEIIMDDYRVAIGEAGRWHWYDRTAPIGGLAAPVDQLIEQLSQRSRSLSDLG